MLSSKEASDIEKVRDKTGEVVKHAIDAKRPVLVEAPPAAGKSTSAYKLTHFAVAPITYLAERKDLYQDAREWAERQSDLAAKAIPSPQRNCPTFEGTNDGELAKAEQLYNKGLSGARIHYHEDVHTPCHSDEDPCKYMERRLEVKRGLETDSIDFLIGNHKHAHNSDYIEDRIVILDEFNPGPFLESFPSDGSLHDSDHPGSIVSHFLEEVDESDDEFPTEMYQDLTDLVVERENIDALEGALQWFEEHGVTRGDVRDYEFYNVTSYRYDPTHLQAPLLTLALLCMRRIGPGIELAPPPERVGESRLREAWENSGMHMDVRCLRDRNTGEIFLLQPPDMTPAKQIIGLDGLPSKQLWDLIFAPESFDHQKIISREDFSQYLASAMNMQVKQLGKGRYPYASGRISDHDEHRLAVIKALEERRFPLISTKRALEKYESRGWMRRYVKESPKGIDAEEWEEDFAVMNFASVTSSNDFEKEDLGVVSGSPFPGYQPLRVWSGLCGVEVDPLALDQEQDFEGVVNDVYEYLSQHQIIQALLRFGRHESVYLNNGATVYVNSTDLPEWFTPHDELTIEKGTKATALIEFLIEAKWKDQKKPLEEQNVKSLGENLDIHRTHIHRILNLLSEEDLIEESDKGKWGSLYRWSGDGDLISLDVPGNSYLLHVGEKYYLLSLSE